MNIVVAMKQIPDLQQIRIRNRNPIFDDVPLTLGKIDKNALEEAILIKDAVGNSQVTVLSAGNENIEDTVKEALAAGADQALLVVDSALNHADSYRIAEVLAAAIKKIDIVDLILFGEGSSDNYSGQVGSRVAEILNLPQVSFASNISIHADRAIITHSLEDGNEVLETPLPAVITVISGINEPRIPSVSQILKAGKKPLEILEIDQLGINWEGIPQTVTLSNLAPEANRKQIVIKSIAELLPVLQIER